MSLSNGDRSAPCDRILTTYRNMGSIERRIVFLALAREAPPAWLHEAIDVDPDKVGRSFPGRVLTQEKIT